MKNRFLHIIVDDNRGFAVAGIVYSILLLFVLLLTSLLLMLGNRKMVLDSISAEITDSIQIEGGVEFIKIGETLSLHAKVRPLSITNQMIQWKSSNPSVATVENGLVTGLKNGTVQITAETVNGMQASITLDIYKAYTTVNILQNSGFEDSTTTGLSKWINYNSRFVAQVDTTNKYQGNKSMKLIASSSSVTYPSYQQVVSLLEGHIYYAMEYVYLDSIPPSDNVTQFDLYRVGGTITGFPEYGNIYLNRFASSFAKKWNRVSFRFTSDVSYDYNFRAVYFMNGNPDIPIWLDNTLFVDLTATFGAGNEPSLEWCDTHINWFDGNSTIYYK